MKFYHGTKKEIWEVIKKDNQLFGHIQGYRYTYLTPDIDVAIGFGDGIVLEVDYMPFGIDGRGIDNFGFNPPKGFHCWQFSVFVPISLLQVRKLTKKEIKELKGTFDYKGFNNQIKKYNKLIR